MSEDKPEGFISRHISGNRSFNVGYFSFTNGCFIFISEGLPRIGAVSISLSSQNNVNSARIIPSKFNPVFTNNISERVSSMINGICLVSLYTTKELSLEDMKAIMGEIMSIVQEEHKNDSKSAPKNREK